MNKNLKLLPKAQLARLKENQVKVVENYSSPVKLKAVMRWKPRLTQAGCTIQMLADKTKREQSRISEWVNFTHEPSEEAFLQIESAVYELEK